MSDIPIEYRDAPLGKSRPETLADLPPSKQLLLSMEDLGDPGRVTILPPMPDIQYRPDGAWLRALRTTCYIVVIITCIMLMIGIIDAYLLMSQMREAVEAWVAGITDSGLLGN